MIASTKIQIGSWERAHCVRCGRQRWTCLHHDTRKNNNRDSKVRLCSNGNPAGVVYPDACHSWAHLKIEEAKKEGYYKEMDSKFRKKPMKKDKWIIKKKVSGANKWKLKKGTGLNQ